MSDAEAIERGRLWKLNDLARKARATARTKEAKIAKAAKQRLQLEKFRERNRAKVILEKRRRSDSSDDESSDSEEGRYTKRRKVDDSRPVWTTNKFDRRFRAGRRSSQRDNSQTGGSSAIASSPESSSDESVNKSNSQVPFNGVSNLSPNSAVVIRKKSSRPGSSDDGSSDSEEGRCNKCLKEIHISPDEGQVGVHKQNCS